ncbi:MAG TPA: PQQ-binding-like beta-propeller repeat protein [Phycisphaerae bacterium]|nr:PQQ-binding-like beta-propeller repeat protein [Phycisphaerae bacterium]
MLEDLVFIGFHSQVVALNRDTGDVVWQWRSRSGKGFVTLLLDGDRLVVSVMGYTYCLDAVTGKELWFNQLKGTGWGVASLASIRGSSAGILLQAAAEEQEQASHTATTT